MDADVEEAAEDGPEQKEEGRVNRKEPWRKQIGNGRSPRVARLDRDNHATARGSIGPGQLPRP
jgi:hypothetical protein